MPPMGDAAPAREGLELRNCTVVNAWSEKLAAYGVQRADVPLELGPCTVVIGADGQVEALRPSAEDTDSAPSGKRVLDFAGHFVFPGLIDSHTHGLPGAAGDLFKALHLLHGVTSIRELAGAPAEYGGKLEAAAIASGSRAGPRMFYVGQALDGPKVALLGSEAITTTEKARAAVRARSRAGAFGVKVYNNMPAELLSHIRDEADQCGMAVMGHCPRSVSLAASCLMDIQHLTGVPDIPCTAWGDDAPSFHGWLNAWEQCSETRLAEVARQAVRDQQVHTPTLSLYFHAAHEAQAPLDAAGIIDTQCSCEEQGGGDDPKLRLRGHAVPAHCCAVRCARSFLPRFLETTLWHPAKTPLPYCRCLSQAVCDAFPAAFPKMLHAVRVLHREGVILHAGTDCLTPWVIPGRGLHEELLLFRGAGLSDEEALAAATSLPGCFLSTLPCHRRPGQEPGQPGRLRMEDSGIAWLGFVCKGAPADLLVSVADPRRDLASALTGIVAVVADGRYYPIEDLRARVKAYQQWCHSSWANRLVPVLAPPLRTLMKAIS